MTGKSFITAILGLMCLTSCQEDSPPFGALAKIESFYDDAREVQFIESHKALAKRDGDILELRLVGGMTARFQNLDRDQCMDKIRVNNITDGSEGCPVQYQVVGYWKRHGIFLLDVFRYYEEHNFELVYADGSITEILEFPFFSSNQTRFATIQDGCGYYPDSLIAIFEMQNGKFEPVHISAFVEDNAIVVRSVRWDGTERVIFDVSDCGYPEAKNATLTVERDQKGKWTWSGPMKATEVERTP